MFNHGLFLQVGQFPMHLLTLVWTIALRGVDPPCLYTEAKIFCFSRSESQYWGPGPILRAQIPALRTKFQPWRPKFSLEGPNPALPPKSQSKDPNPKVWKEKEKIPHMSESTGHQALWGRCPAPALNFNHNLLGQGTSTADHQTLLRLFIPIMQLKQTLNLICILQLYRDLINSLNEIFFRCNDWSFVDHCPWV